MDFTLLTENELDEFLTQDYSQYDIYIDPDLSKVEQAKLLFNQLKVHSDVEYPLSIVDLYLASQYHGSLDQQYTLGELSSLTQGQIDTFVEKFNMKPPITTDRITRILSYLGLVIDPKEIILNPGITEVICNQLSLGDTINLMQSLGVRSLNCIIPINDPDKYISQVTNIRLENIPYLYQIELEGSVETVMGLIKSNFPKQLRYLLSNGLNPNLQNFRENTALMTSSKVGNSSAVKLLLQYGADPSLQNPCGDSALILSSHRDHSDIVELLLQFGADPNTQNGAGNTALMLASDEGYSAIVKLLLQLGANPNLQDRDGDTALTTAVREGYPETVKVLLQFGANPDLQNQHGETGLMLASYKDHLKIAKLLLQSGADPNLQSLWWKTALFLASRKGHLEVADLLSQYGSRRI